MKIKMLKVEGILLGLDGTVVNSKKARLEATKIALKTIEQKITDAKWQHKFQKGSNKTFQ